MNGALAEVRTNTSEESLQLSENVSSRKIEEAGNDMQHALISGKSVAGGFTGKASLTGSVKKDMNTVKPAHHFANISVCQKIPAGIQPKLSINTPADEYEQEADAVADKIMRMPESGPVKASPSPVKIQRKCAGCGKEEEREEEAEDVETGLIKNIQRKCAACEEEEEKQLQRKESDNKAPAVSANVQQVIQSQGQPLDKQTRSFMENRFGFDFGKVQIHNDSLAHQSAKDINALAYTHQHHIAFGTGQYRPNTESGKKLLAHELTHVVQQGASFQQNLIQKAEGGDPQVATVKRPITIPPGLNSEQELDRYAEIQIFGRVVNKKWRQLGLDVKSKAGKTINYIVPVSDLNNYGEGPGEKEKKQSAAEYAATSGELRTGINAEIDRRYYQSTGIPSDQKIKSKNETGNIAIWNSLRDKVMAEKRLIENMPPAIKELFKGPNPITPDNYEQVAGIIQKLMSLSNAELADYKSKINASTTNFDEFEASIDQYISELKQRKIEQEKLETVRAQLYGLDEIYVKYKEYKALEISSHGTTGWERTGDGPRMKYTPASKSTLDKFSQAELDLTASLQQYKINSIGEFEKLIAEFESSFVTETVHIANDLLSKYEHVLYEEEQKFNDPAYISQIYSQLSQTKAKEKYNEADSNRSTATMIMPADPGKYAPGDIELKAKLRTEANSLERSAESDVSGIASASPLMKNKDFDKRELAFAEQDEIKSIMLSYIADRREDIATTREDLADDPMLIFKLDDLLKAAYEQQQIEPGGIHDQIITDRRRQISRDEAIIKILVAVFAVALGLLTFGGGTIAVIGAVGAFGISAFQAIQEFKEYETKHAAYGSGLLSDDPSIGWVVVAVIGAGLDLGAAVAAVKALAPAAKILNETGDIVTFEKSVSQIKEIDAVTKANVVKAAKLEAQYKSVMAVLNPGARMSIGIDLIPTYSAMAYFAVRRGIIRFEQWLLELKGLKVIEDAANLTPEELTILKQAFEEAKATTKTLEEVTPQLQKSINDFRKSTGIGRTVTSEGVKGGTSAAAKPKIEGFAEEIITEGSTKSKGASAATVRNNPRYQSPQKFGGTKNHAEQNVLGDLADKLDATFTSKTDAKGNVYVLVEQEVCSACRQGLTNPEVDAGVVKQFSQEYPNITLIVTNNRTPEVLFVKGGKIVNRATP